MKKILIVLALLLAPSAFASIMSQPGIVWEVNTSATSGNVNGGGFDILNANFKTDFACSSATSVNPVCSSATLTGEASGGFLAADVNGWIYIKSGTHWQPTAFYKIVDACVASAWSQGVGVGACTTGQALLDAAIGHALQIDSTRGNPRPLWITNTVAGVSNDATASVSGGTFGVDFSQPTSARVTASDIGCTAGTPFTCTAGAAILTLGSKALGNTIHITSTGTGAHFIIQWYDVVNVATPGTNFALDRESTTGGNGVAGAYHLGGAISLGTAGASVGDNIFFGNFFSQNGTGANRVFVKAGTYTLGISITAGQTGASQNHVTIEGYNAIRGDAPTGANRPVINGTSAINMALAGGQDIYNLIISGPFNGSMLVHSGSALFNSKVISTYLGGTGQAAIASGNGEQIINTEAVSYRGPAVALTTGAAAVDTIFGCNFHDSDIGLTTAGAASAGVTVASSLIHSNTTAAVQTSAAMTGYLSLNNDTLYGGENKANVAGVSTAAGTTSIRMLNTILYGFATGAVNADTQTYQFDSYNDFFNNTADTSNYQKGSTDLALNPSFANLGQVTGTTATMGASNHIVDTGKNFTTLGVTAGQDYVYVSSGTGATVAHALISSITTTTNPNDTLVTDVSLGSDATADKNYTITIGRNFAITNNTLKSAGFPGTFPAGLTSGTLSVGASQASASGGQHNYAYQN